MGLGGLGVIHQGETDGQTVETAAGTPRVAFIGGDHTDGLKVPPPPPAFRSMCYASFPIDFFSPAAARDCHYERVSSVGQSLGIGAFCCRRPALRHPLTFSLNRGLPLGYPAEKGC